MAGAKLRDAALINIEADDIYAGLGEGNGNGGIGGGDFALVMPNEANAMRRKMMRACRGAAPKRPTEPG